MEAPLLADCAPSLRLALYSDQVIAANGRLDMEVLRLLEGSARRIGYLTSAPDPARRFFAAKQSYYARYGAIDLVYFDPENLGSSGALDELLGCDALHLAGGDTRGFLGRLNRAGLVSPLRDYARSGKPLIGTSAGAILMTPSIALNALFEGAGPADSPDQAALDLLPFEFFPHLQAYPAHLEALTAYSLENGGRPIFGCPDGDGILVENGAARAIGAIVEIRDGAVNPRRQLD
ncbi:Type 1 glutamine amidotransferase-like domain-containing protein [Dongia sp. agr-C8]